MKKHHRIYTAAAIAALLMGTAVAVPQTIIPKSTLTASAATTIRETIGGVTYEFDSTAKTATIVGIDDSKKSFTTPEKVKYNNTNYDVVAIGSYGCANKPNLKTLTITSNIKSLGHMFCGNCTALETVKITGTPVIERLAFNDCKVLKNVTLDDSMTEIGEQMFSGCEGLKTITLPSKLTKIKYAAFSNCTSLTSITIPDTVTTIGYSAFSGCSSLKSVKLPSKLKVIDENTFRDCSSLKLPTLPSTLTTIGEEAFKNTSAMTGTLIISANIKEIKAHCFEGSGITEILSQGSATIFDGAFSYMPNLKKVTLTGKETLKERVFNSSKKLSNLVVPFSAANNWHHTTFQHCTGLKYLNSQKVTYSYNSSKEDVVFTGSDVDAFIRKHFNASTGVGFIDDYVDYYCDVVISKYTNSGMTAQQKVKALHDWVIKKVNYDHADKGNPKNHCECSLFINDTTVCQGYAYGFNKLLKRAGFESEIAGGTNHVWNKCKFGDIYLNIDACWDDAADTTTPSYKWFMLTDKECLEFEATSHNCAQSYPFSVNPMGDLNMDKVVDEADIELLKNYLTTSGSLNSNQALLADLDFNGKLNGNDLTLLKQKYGKRFDLNGDGKINNNDHALLQFNIVKQVKLSNEKTFKADNNNDDVVTWKDAEDMRYYLEKYCGQNTNAYYRIGDLDLNGKVNNNDLTALYNYVNKNISFKADKKLADLNNDGKVDSNDLSLLNTLTNYQIGDVDFNGKVNKADKELILKHIARSKTLPDKALWYADLNGDGSIDVKDAVKLCVDYNIPN